MTLFQSIIGVVFALGFLTLLFMFVGYFALPVFFILTIIGLFNFFRGHKLFIRTARTTNNPFGPMPRESVYRKQDDKVIDVDYTELP